MVTRSQYMNKEISYNEYYAQFVTESLKKFVLSHFGKEKLEKHLAADDMFHEDHIKLEKWNDLYGICHSLVSQKKIKEAGEGFAPATSVCILKEAARLAVRD